MAVSNKKRRYWCPCCGEIFEKVPGKGRVVCPHKECKSVQCYRCAIGGGVHSRTMYRLRYNERKKQEAEHNDV